MFRHIPNNITSRRASACGGFGKLGIHRAQDNNSLLIFVRICSHIRDLFLSSLI